MLQFIRERAQSWIAWVIVGLIIIPFALWGIHQYFGGGKEPPAAQVNDTAISQAQVQQVVYQQQLRLRDMLGENYRPELFSEMTLRRQVLEGLIEQELILQTASAGGMRIGNALLAATIHSAPAFQSNGQFSAEHYTMALRSQGMEPGSFEGEMRRDMLVQQVYSGIVRSDFVTAPERQSVERLLGQKRDLGFIVVPLKRYLSEASISDEEVAAHYEEQAGAYMQPEQVSVAYIELSAEQLAQDIQIGENELQARYDAHPQAYSRPEERRARHILIQASENAGADEDAAAYSTIGQLLEQIRAGGDFAALAGQESQDPVSAAQGGDLGFFGRGVMDKAFEDAVFALQVGEVSEPVRSAFGYHLIQLEAVRGGEIKAFDEIKDQLQADMRRERAEQQYYDLAEQLASLAYEHPESLDEAASQIGLEIGKSEAFSRQGGEGFTANPRVIEAAFSEDVLARNNNSEAIELERNHMVVLRVLEHQPEVRKPLESVQEEIVEKLSQAKASLLARQAADELLEQLQQGAAPEELARQTENAWQRNESMGRTGSEADNAIVQKAFSMPRPQADTPTWGRAAVSTGDEAVLVLYAVKDGDEAALEESDISSELAQAAGEAGFSAVVASRRAAARIKLQPLQQLD